MSAEKFTIWLYSACTVFMLAIFGISVAHGVKWLAIYSAVSFAGHLWLLRITLKELPKAKP